MLSELNRANEMKGRLSILKLIAISITILVVVVGIVLYRNFNRILSDALLKSFNTTLAADVYELKFENLSVNLFEGSIRVHHVSLVPREKYLHDYPYINSSFRLTTEEIHLENVEIRKLIKSNRLIVSRISIIRPTIDVSLTGTRNIMMPFRDSTTVVDSEKKEKELLSFFQLSQFQLKEASFNIKNSGKERAFQIKDFNISLSDLQLEQEPGQYIVSFEKANLSIGTFDSQLEKDVFNAVNFTKLAIGFDSLSIQLTLDTLKYQFKNLKTELHDLNIQTKDSLFNITMNSLNLNYADKQLILKEVSLTPNVRHAVIQRKFKFQHAEFSGSIRQLELSHVNFDSLLYYQKIKVDTLKLSGVKAKLFKDKTKPMDSTKRPDYTAQKISALTIPLRINYLKAMDVHLENTERKPDSTYATINITRGNLVMKNITNQSVENDLVIDANAYINDKAKFKANVQFSYKKPHFTFDCSVNTFNLPDLNPLIQAYTPAKIISGVADEIVFSGSADQTTANGMMRFLYNDLEIDLVLHEKAKWKSSVIAFAANTILQESNPVSETLPPRNVQFHVKRDMTKGFLNVLIKSLLDGLKETMIMSKENRKQHKEDKKKSQENNR